MGKPAFLKIDSNEVSTRRVRASTQICDHRTAGGPLALASLLDEAAADDEEEDATEVGGCGRRSF